MKVGYLGPKGNFSEQVALSMFNETELVGFSTIDDVLFAVDHGEVDKGVVPIENSIEGAVNVTVDNLIFDTELFIEKQIILPIEQNLMVRQNSKKEQITKIYSHPQSLAQCKKYLNIHFNGIDTIPLSSNAQAAKFVSEEETAYAAIGPRASAELYNLTILDSGIQDQKNNYTVFILVSKDQPGKIEINQKITMAFSTFNQPGALRNVVDIFYMWDINMTKIVSRPMRNKAGEYVFFIDIEDYRDEKDLSDTIDMLKRKTNFFKMLGSYSVLDLTGGR